MGFFDKMRNRFKMGKGRAKQEAGRVGPFAPIEPVRVRPGLPGAFP